MGWAEAIKAAIVAIPKLLDLFRDLGTRIDALVKVQQEKHAQEIRNEQRFAAIELQKAQSDQERLELARRLSELERRIH